jgi:hypothetical protein
LSIRGFFLCLVAALSSRNFFTTLSPFPEQKAKNVFFLLLLLQLLHNSEQSLRKCTAIFFFWSNLNASDA